MSDPKIIMILLLIHLNLLKISQLLHQLNLSFKIMIYVDLKIYGVKIDLNKSKKKQDVFLRYLIEEERKE